MFFGTAKIRKGLMALFMVVSIGSAPLLEAMATGDGGSSWGWKSWTFGGLLAAAACYFAYSQYCLRNAPQAPEEDLTGQSSGRTTNSIQSQTNHGASSRGTSGNRVVAEQQKPLSVDQVKNTLNSIANYKIVPWLEGLIWTIQTVYANGSAYTNSDQVGILDAINKAIGKRAKYGDPSPDSDMNNLSKDFFRNINIKIGGLMALTSDFKPWIGSQEATQLLKALNEESILLKNGVVMQRALLVYSSPTDNDKSNVNKIIEALKSLSVDQSSVNRAAHDNWIFEFSKLLDQVGDAKLYTDDLKKAFIEALNSRIDLSITEKDGFLETIENTFKSKEDWLL